MRYLAYLSILLIGLACSNSNEQQSLENLDYKSQGELIAKHSFKALSQKLQNAMANGGVQEAISYCNVSALALTDSLAEFYKADIKRSAIRYRNEKNKPDSLEMAVMVDYLRGMSVGLKPESKVIEYKGSHRFIKPIFTNTLCLNCHGTPGVNMPEENAEIILEKYPSDLATGFAEGDLRGVWSIALKDNE